MNITFNKKWILPVVLVVSFLILLGLVFRGRYTPPVDYNKEKKAMQNTIDSLKQREVRYRTDSAQLEEENRQFDTLIREQNAEMNRILAENREFKIRGRELKVRISMYEKNLPMVPDTVCQELLFLAVSERDSVQWQFDEYILRTDTTIKGYQGREAVYKEKVAKRDTLYAKLRVDYSTLTGSYRYVLKTQNDITKKYKRERLLVRILSATAATALGIAILK